jgi:hypothetical protein
MSAQRATSFQLKGLPMNAQASASVLATISLTTLAFGFEFELEPAARLNAAQS